jgi:hypothetical protein
MNAPNCDEYPNCQNHPSCPLFADCWRQKIEQQKKNLTITLQDFFVELSQLDPISTVWGSNCVRAFLAAASRNTGIPRGSTRTADVMAMLAFRQRQLEPHITSLAVREMAILAPLIAALGANDGLRIDENLMDCAKIALSLCDIE